MVTANLYLLSALKSLSERQYEVHKVPSCNDSAWASEKDAFILLGHEVANCCPFPVSSLFIHRSWAESKVTLILASLSSQNIHILHMPCLANVTCQNLWWNKYLFPFLAWFESRHSGKNYRAEQLDEDHRSTRADQCAKSRGMFSRLQKVSRIPSRETATEACVCRGMK